MVCRRLFVDGAADLLCEICTAFAALCEHFGKRNGRAQLLADPLHYGDLRIGIGVEAVDCHHYGHAVFAHVFQMRFQIDNAFFKRTDVFFAQIRFRHAAVVFECANGRDQHHAGGLKPRDTAFDVQEFFCAEICTEARLRNAVVGEL